MSSAANACRQKFIGVSENGGVLHVEMIHKKRKEKKEKKTEAKPRSASAVMRRRSAVCMTILVVCGAAVAGKLLKVSVVDNQKYETLANNYHFGTMTLRANRGAIYDANGTALAWSATVYNVYIDPKQYQDEMDAIEKANAKKEETAAKNNEEAANLVDVDQLKQSITTFLVETLGIDRAELEESYTKSGRYYVLKTQVEKDVADEITTYFDKLKLSFIGEEATTRRYYPQNELAAAVIGFTNGDGDVSLVLARTEEGTTDARGLSMLVYDKRDGGVKVRRIENKMGIKGSPTCELVFTNAPAQLVGDRKMGLIKYVMSLMNAARLGIGAQSVGLCEAAYREALKYAQEREQFGKPIIRFAAVAEMLSNMKAKLQGVRALLYETTRFVEVYKQYGHIAHERPLEGDERQEMKFYNRLADGFTPLVKLFSSEYANQQAYDAIQIHGGSGFMKDYPCERLYRDARIMNIYEGTSQLQVVAAINAVTKGTFMEQIERYAAESYSEAMCPVVTKLKELTVKFSEMLARVEAGDKEVCGFKDFHARRLVETAGHIIITYLLARQAGESEEYVDSAKIFCKLAEGKISEAYTYVMNSTLEDVALFRAGE